jgi:hypothetical protein
MWTVPNIALLTECRLLSDSLAINMSLLRSAEQEQRNVYRRRQLDISSLRRSEMFMDLDSLILSSLR